MMKYVARYVLLVAVVASQTLFGRQTVQNSFRELEHSMRAQRDVRDRLEGRRGKLASAMAKKEAVIGEQLAVLGADRRTLAALDAELAEANAILRDFGLQQSHMMEQIQEEKMASQQEVRDALSGSRARRKLKRS